MTKDIKLLSTVIPSFNASINESNLNERAPLGMGFVYRASVSRGRNNLQDAHYIGITSRTVGQRKDEHLKAAKSLGVINPKRIKRYEQENGYMVKGNKEDRAAAPLHAIMRTAMGTRQTIESRSDGSPYFSMGELARTSLHSLGVMEQLLIDQSKSGADVDGINMMNYEKLRHANSMNRGAGGLGLVLRNFAAAERAISAWIYLKYESSEVLSNSKELLTRLTQLTYGGTGRGAVSQSNVLSYLQTYLKFGDEIQATIDGEQYTSLKRIKSHIDAIMRPRGDADIGGISGSEMRRMVAMAGDAEITNSSLFALYKGVMPQGMKMSVTDLQREQAREIIGAIVQGVQSHIEKYSKRR